MNKILENPKIVKIGIAVCVLALLILSLGIVIKSNVISHFTEHKNKGNLVAVVNGYNVYESDLSDRLNMLANGQKITIEDIPENILKAMVLEVAVNHQIDENAKKEGYNNDKIILQQVKNYKTGLIREKYLNDKVYSKITDEMSEKETDEEIERAIDDIIKYNPLNIYKKVKTTTKDQEIDEEETNHKETD